MDTSIDISVTVAPDWRESVAACRDYLRLYGSGPFQDGIFFALGAVAAAVALWTKNDTACLLAVLGILVGCIGWIQRRRWIRNRLAAEATTAAGPATLRFADDAIRIERGVERSTVLYSSMGSRFLLRNGRILFLRGKLYGGFWPAAVLDAVGADRLASKLEAAGLARIKRSFGLFRVFVLLLVLVAAAAADFGAHVYARSPGRMVRWVLDGRRFDEVGGRLGWVVLHRFADWPEDVKTSFLLRTMDGVDGHSGEEFSECVVGWGFDAALIERAKKEGRDVEPALRQEIVARRWTVSLEPDEASGRWALVAAEKGGLRPDGAERRILTGIPVTTEASAHIGFGRAIVERAGSEWDEEYLFTPPEPGRTDYLLVRRQ